MMHTYVVKQLYKYAGHLSSLYTPEELDDPVGVAGIVLEEYPLPELKLDDDDPEEFNIGNDDGVNGINSEILNS